MKRINIELEDLRIIQAVAEEKNFRRAAEKVFLSPSALSRAVSRVEDRLGTRLFERDTRNVELTNQGQEFARTASIILANAHQSLGRFHDYLALRRGRLTIAGLPSITGGVLPKIIAEFSRKHPNLEVRILDNLNAGVLEAVEIGEADIGLAESRFVSGDKLTFQPLLQDKFIAIAAKGGGIDEDRSYSWEELLKLPHITMAHGTSVRTIVQATYTQLNREFHPKFEVSHLSTAGALVAQGMGVTILPTLTLPIIGADRFVTRELKSPVVTRSIGLFWRTTETLSPAVKAFVSVVEQQTGIKK